MSKRKVYYVSPKPDKSGWQVKQSSKEVLSNHMTKANAIKAGIKVAKNSGLGQLKIQKQDGKFQEERTYGKDPYPPKG